MTNSQHDFVPGDPLPPDEHGEWEASVDVTDWCKVCGWHRDHEIHQNLSENAASTQAGHHAE